ncbi:MAG: Fpg/Nei family DNA glycosylase [Armatimonadota bacterium]
MIDMIEARLIGQQISEHLTGKRIAVAEMAQKKEGSMRDDYLLHVEPDEFKLRLEGAVLTAAYAKYRHICIETSSGYGIDISDLYGKILFIGEGSKIPGNPPISLKFDDGSSLIVLPGVWGAMSLAQNQQLQEFRDSSDPEILDILSDSFSVSTIKVLMSIDEFKDSTMKEFNSRHAKPCIMSLFGAYSQEVLYRAGIHPKKKVANLSDLDIEKFCTAVKDVANEAVRLGGRASERDLFNKSGGFVPSLSPDNVGKACVKCGSAISALSLGGARKYIICPGCQTI